ncbi:SIMPL domain-containing protein [Siminovitchia sediminis]|uniref:SIMPL domain-containing protein n=1 Tax=Siminovitchia sediminis TaxID=1274353 RepID=A0ABW4KFQ1_9BACI
MYYPPAYRTVKSKPKVIKVTGEGRLSVEPDRAEVRFGVSVERQALAEAQRENANMVSAIKKGLNRAGIPPEEIKTVDYSIYPQHDYNQGKKHFRNYKVEHMLLITLTDIDRTGPFVDTVVQNGANVVPSITFSVSDYDHHYRQSLTLAIQNARGKAETIAKTMGLQLEKSPLSVAEGTGEEVIPIQTQAFAVSESPTDIQPGALEIISHVIIEYTYTV